MDLKGAFVGAALLSVAGEATAYEMLNPNIIDDILANQDVLAETAPDIQDPLYDLVEGLLQDGNADMGVVSANKFAETTLNYSEDGFLDIQSTRFPQLTQLDVSGMYKMCRDNPDSCPEPDNRFSVFIADTPEFLATLQETNFRINATHVQMNDIDRYGESDVWVASDGSGADCEDFVLAKESDLLAQGIPGGAIRKISVLTSEGEGHEVLGIATFSGTYVLDNLKNEIYTLSSSDFEVVAATTPQEPWKKAPSLSMSFNDAFADSLEQQELAYYAPFDDTLKTDAYGVAVSLVEPVSVVPLPRSRPSNGRDI